MFQELSSYAINYTNNVDGQSLLKLMLQLMASKAREAAKLQIHLAALIFNRNPYLAYQFGVQSGSCGLLQPSHCFAKSLKSKKSTVPSLGSKSARPQ